MPELTISTEGGKNFSFDLDRTLSKNNGYSVEKQSNDTVTLYITAGENSLNTFFMKSSRPLPPNPIGQEPCA